ncbi:MAG: hypothetical protein Q7T25_14045, partial [Sideroxyarcus sp.]|nr:hypothetical protein [Sideroxyarcus sp.]
NGVKGIGRIYARCRTEPVSNPPYSADSLTMGVRPGFKTAFATAASDDQSYHFEQALKYGTQAVRTMRLHGRGEGAVGEMPANPVELCKTLSNRSCRVL